MYQCMAPAKDAACIERHHWCAHHPSGHPALLLGALHCRPAGLIDQDCGGPSRCVPLATLCGYPMGGVGALDLWQLRGGLVNAASSVLAPWRQQVPGACLLPCLLPSP